MVGRKVALKLLEDHEKLKATYNGRVKGLQKKTRELSTLCDVPALLISFGPTGTSCTWPEGPQQVCALISKFKTCDMRRKRGRHLLRGPSTDLQVAKAHKSRTSLEFSSISAALLQDHQLEKMSLQELKLLYNSINRASQMVEDKIKFLDDQKCLRGCHEMEHSEVIELNSVQDRVRSSCVFTDSATGLDQEFIMYTDQLDMFNSAGNSMLPYEAIMSNTVVSIRQTNNATELGHQIITYGDHLDRTSCIYNWMVPLPYEVTPSNLVSTGQDCEGRSSNPLETELVAYDDGQLEVTADVVPNEVSPPLLDPISINKRSSSTLGNLTIEAAEVDHRITRYSNHLNEGQIENMACPHEVICNEAIDVSELWLEQEAIESDDQVSEDLGVGGVDPTMNLDLIKDANRCQIISEQCMEQFPASMATDHAGYSLQEIVTPSTSQAEYDLTRANDPPCTYTSSPQLYLAEEEMRGIDDMCYWISQHDDMFSPW